MNDIFVTTRIPMPRLGKVRRMGTCKSGLPYPETEELRKLRPLVIAANNMFMKERAELMRLMTLYSRLCEDYSNGLDSRFAEFMEKLTEIPR